MSARSDEGPSVGDLGARPRPPAPVVRNEGDQGCFDKKWFDSGLISIGLNKGEPEIKHLL